MVEQGPNKEIPQKEAVIFLLYKDGEVLLETRIEDDNFYGSTVVPGGKVELQDYQAESDYRRLAARRETKEELGVEVTLLDYLFSFPDVTPNGNAYLFHSFLIRGWEGEVVNQEPEKRIVFWVPFEEAINLCSLDASRQIIIRARTFLNSKAG